jgi:glycosyltransferase involved in cell wall biosynthesis
MRLEATRIHAVHLAPGHVAFDTRVFHKEARTLVEHGLDVTVVAPHDRDEIVDGIQVKALPRPTTRFERFVGGQWSLLKIAWRADGHVYHLHDIDAWPVGVMMRMRGRRVVLDSHEDYPRLAQSRLWVPRLLRKPVAMGVTAIERLMALVANAVISAEDEGAARFPVRKTTVVRNYVLDDEFERLSGGSRTDTVRRVIYVGSMSRERGIFEIVRALPRSSASVPVELVLLGDLGTLREELAELPQWAQVRAPGYVSRGVVERELLASDVGVLLLHPTPKYSEGAVPIKLFEYMAAGLPIVSSDLSTTRSVIGEADCGVLVDPLDVSSIRSAIEALLGDPLQSREMGARGRAYVRKHCLWSSQVPALIEVYGVVTRSLLD